MTHLGTVQIETERLILRRLEMSDADAVFRNWCSDPEVTKYLMWQPHKNVDESKEFITGCIQSYEKPDNYLWAIVLKNIGEPIGTISAVRVDDLAQSVHIGYALGKAWWRQGYMSEALTRLVEFFFEDVGVNRVESHHDPLNLNSGKVMLKAGLKYEATLRQSDWNNQGICDASWYALLKEEYYG